MKQVAVLPCAETNHYEYSAKCWCAPQVEEFPDILGCVHSILIIHNRAN